MPLIIVTGTPCSGKTFRARQVFEEFQARTTQSPSVSVTYLPSYHASLDPSSNNPSDYEEPTESQNPRDVVYDSARLEKTARAEEFSAIKRALNKNTIVVADSPNYIKGFRYQLHCEAKAAGTRSVVLHTAARQDECERWNDERLTAWGRDTADSTLHFAETKASGDVSKVGKDVLGDLEPESHTALYGDTVLNGNRSRTSSTGAASSDVEEDQSKVSQSKRADDTMTLKSLYITARPRIEDEGEITTIPPDVPAQKNSPRSLHLPKSIPPDPRSSLPYAPSTFKSLAMRYEPPSPFTRWDTPLFTIPSSDPHPPYDEIWTSLFPNTAKSGSKKALLRERQEEQRVTREQSSTAFAQHMGSSPQAPQVSAVRQNAATVLPSATTPDALQTLESTTGEVAKLVLAAAQEAGVAEGEEHTVLSITLPSVESDDLVLEMEKPEGVVLSQPKLQRLRRKFGQMQRGNIAHGHGHVVGRRAVAVEFARFLEGEWAIEDAGVGV